MQETEGVLRYKRSAIQAHTADGFGYPSRVAAEQFVVIRRAQEFNDPQFHDEMVDEFLSFFLRQCSFCRSRSI